MNMSLFAKALTKFFLGVILVGVLVFLPAGTLGFVKGWIMMGVLFVPMFFAGLIMLKKSPSLLESRLDAKEKQGDQQTVLKLSGLMFIGGFVVAGLDYRFGWLEIPMAVSLGFAAVFLLGYIMYAEVLRENSYLSRTVKVQEGQKVISTGLYGVVRHPMYSATLILFLSIPLILGSVYAFLIFLLYPFIIAKRIKGEEAFLEKELEGYAEYKQKVKFRLIPFIW